MDRQKIVLVFGIALLSAAALTWFLYANTVVPKTEKRTWCWRPRAICRSGTLAPQDRFEARRTGERSRCAQGRGHHRAGKRSGSRAALPGERQRAV